MVPPPLARHARLPAEVREQVRGQVAVRHDVLLRVGRREMLVRRRRQPLPRRRTRDAGDARKARDPHVSSSAPRRRGQRYPFAHGNSFPERVSFAEWDSRREPSLRRWKRSLLRHRNAYGQRDSRREPSLRRWKRSLRHRNAYGQRDSRREPSLRRHRDAYGQRDSRREPSLLRHRDAYGQHDTLREPFLRTGAMFPTTAETIPTTALRPRRR